MAKIPDRLKTDATAFAKRYVSLVDALLKEGVEEIVARTEARLAAIGLLMETGEVSADDTPCPMCGRGGYSLE